MHFSLVKQNTLHLLEVHLIILRLAFSFMLDVNTSGIGAAFVSISLTITSANWGPVVRTSHCSSSRNTSSLKGSVQGTGAAVALVKFAELAVVTELGGGRSTLTTRDFALRLLYGAACSSHRIRATGRPSISVALLIRTVGTVACAKRAHALGDDFLAIVLGDAFVVVSIPIATTDGSHVLRTRLAGGIGVADGSTSSFSKTAIIVSVHITATVLRSRLSQHGMYYCRQKIKLHSWYSPHRCEDHGASNRRFGWAFAIRANLSIRSFGDALVAVSGTVTTTDGCINGRTRCSPDFITFSLVFDVNSSSIGIAFGSVRDTITSAKKKSQCQK
jgi:hypothetical protein